MTTITASREKVLRDVLQSDDLPTLPMVASKLISMIGREETSLADIADLITADIGLSAKILKVSNSAFYSFPKKINTISQAVSVLGTNAVYSLVLSFSFLSMAKGGSKTNFDLKKFWQESLTGAVAAKLIMEQVADEDTEEIFTAALLRNIGKLIQALTLPGLYNQVLDRLQEDKQKTEIEIEEEIIGASHCDIGYVVTKEWGLPQSLQLPIKHHDLPEKYECDSKQMVQAINIVYMATLLTNIIHSDNPEQWHKLFRADANKLLQLKTPAINKILEELHHKVDLAAEHFGLSMSVTRSIEEVLQEANIKLTLLNLSYEEMNRELIDSKLKLEHITLELNLKNKLLEDMANIDGLTEIHNHRYFQSFLDQEINRSIRNQNNISILLADIDHFKKFNDNHGHQTGDFILKEFSRICKENIREYDLIARYGGEEFVFVLPDTKLDDAVTVAEKIRTIVENYSFDDGDSTYQVTISIGVASARPTGQNFKKHEFIGFADEAMYKAKRAGRNRVSLYQPDKKKKWFNL